MDGSSPRWQIIEETAYTKALPNCGNLRALDVVLEVIDFGLARNPLSWPMVPGFPHLRLVKTKIRFVGPEVVPALRMWFQPYPESLTVHKLYIEPAPPDDMKFGETIWGGEDDGLPF